jgi:hypothetical protein
MDTRKAIKVLDMEAWLHAILASTLDGGKWSASFEGHFMHGEKPPVFTE